MFSYRVGVISITINDKPYRLLRDSLTITVKNEAPSLSTAYGVDIKVGYSPYYYFKFNVEDNIIVEDDISPIMWKNNILAITFPTDYLDESIETRHFKVGLDQINGDYSTNRSSLEMSGYMIDNPVEMFEGEYEFTV